MTDEEIIKHIKNYLKTYDNNELKPLSKEIIMHFKNKNDAVFLNAFAVASPASQPIIETKLFAFFKCEEEESDLIYKAVMQAEDLHREIMNEIRKSYNDGELDGIPSAYFQEHVAELAGDVVPVALYDYYLEDIYQEVMEHIAENFFVTQNKITTIGPSKRPPGY